MSMEQLATELSQMHIDYARLLTQVAGALSASGETGVLLWLNQRTTDTYAVDITEHFGLTPGRVANIVKRLEQRSYIRREQESGDLRKSRIVPTAEGSAQANRIFADMNAGHTRMLNALGDDDAESAVRVLRHILRLADGGIEMHSPNL